MWEKRENLYSKSNFYYRAIVPNFAFMGFIWTLFPTNKIKRMFMRLTGITEYLIFSELSILDVTIVYHGYLKRKKSSFR